MLFEAGGRVPPRWFKSNPMVRVQSLLELSLTLIAVYQALHWMGVDDEIAQPLALLAMAASPVVLARVLIDNRASGPVSDRAIALSTLSTLYALALCSASAGLMARGRKVLAAWFMEDQPFMPQENDYLVYTYNRFQACRFGLDAVYVDPVSGKHMPLREHIWLTFRQIESHAQRLGAASFISLLHGGVQRGQNDARWLREKQADEALLAEVVRQAAQRFRGDAA